MDTVIERLNNTIHNLKPYIGLANSHMVDFFNKTLWDCHVPQELQNEFFSTSPRPDIIKLFSDGSKESHSKLKYFLDLCTDTCEKGNDNIILDFEVFKNKFPQVNFPSTNFNRNNKFMTEKKEHEVDRMSFAVTTLSSFTGCTHIIDMGDGKGYLSSHLAMEYGLKVLGLDSCFSNTMAAAVRLNKIEKQYSANKNKSERDNLLKHDSHLSYEYTTKDMFYKQMTIFVSSDTDLKRLLVEKFPKEDNFKLGLIGLHTCGKLSPACLKLFLSNLNDSMFLINVGCCYHFLEESEESDNFTFPLSSYLRKANYKLGRNARMLSMQAPERVYSSKKIPNSLMFRAVFESYLFKEFDKSSLSDMGRVGKIGSKCKTFEEYCRKGLHKLGLVTNASSTELQDFYEEYLYMQPMFEYYYMMRVSIAPIIETVIILDRLLYLHENGLRNSFIVKMFDPHISPRCYAIISIKED